VGIRQYRAVELVEKAGGYVLDRGEQVAGVPYAFGFRW
jgi:hypothetical protein